MISLWIFKMDVIMLMIGMYHVFSCNTQYCNNSSVKQRHKGIILVLESNMNKT